MRPLNAKIENFFHFDFKSNSTLLVDAQKTYDAILLLFGKPGKTELPDWLLYVPAKSCQYIRSPKTSLENSSGASILEILN